MQLDMFDSSESVDQKKENQSEIVSQISGLTYMPNFVTPKEHEVLWNAIDKEEWQIDLKRRVQHYGWKYDYKARSIDYSMYLGELPDWGKPIAERLYTYELFPEVPDQMIVNEYEPGQGIAHHVDCEPCFGSNIATISLGSPCIMEFIHIKTKEKLEVRLEPESLAVFSGEARYSWKHGIPARIKDKIDDNRSIKRERRISLTFRNVIIDNS